MFMVKIDNQCYFIFYNLKSLLKLLHCTTPEGIVPSAVNLCEWCSGLKGCCSFTTIGSPAIPSVHIDDLGLT